MNNLVPANGRTPALWLFCIWIEVGAISGHDDWMARTYVVIGTGAVFGVIYEIRERGS